MNTAIVLSVFAVLASGIRVRNVQKTQQKGLQFKVAFVDDDTKPNQKVPTFVMEGESLVPLDGGFKCDPRKPAGLGCNAVKEFMSKILTDLPADVAEKLKTCSPSMKGNQNMDPPTNNEVWVLMTLEKLEPKDIKLKLGWGAPKTKMLLIGQPGPGDDDYVTDRLRHVYVPGASIEFTELDNYTPMDLVNRNASESKSMSFLGQKDDSHVYAYQHHNCKATREGLFDAMCQGLKTNSLSCSALGRCKGTSGLAKLDDSHDDRAAVNSQGKLMRDENAINRYSKYKFVEAFEENAGVMLNGAPRQDHGYISEKMMTALLAGAVPVYGGGADARVHEVINEKAILVADPKDMSKTSDRIAYLMKHPAEYEAMVKADAVTEKQMTEYFTWHPATWPKYGDHLRMKIVNEILGLCALP